MVYIRVCGYYECTHILSIKGYRVCRVCHKGGISLYHAIMGVYPIWVYMEDTVCPYTMGYVHNRYNALVLYTVYATWGIHVLLYSVCILSIRGCTAHVGTT